MKNRKRKAAAAIILLAAAFAYHQRYLAVNRAIPPVPVETYAVGETVDFGEDILVDFTMKGYSVRVNSSQVMTYEEFLERHKAEDEYTYVPDRVCEVSVTLRNDGADDSTGINLSDFYIQGESVCESINFNLCETANPSLKGAIAIALRRGTQMDIVLPFNLFEEHFRSSVWAHLEDFDLNLVATLYPVKKVVALRQ